jgi:hypothetical protein
MNEYWEMGVECDRLGEGKVRRNGKGTHPEPGEREREQNANDLVAAIN